MTIAVRPEDVHPCGAGEKGNGNVVEGTVAAVVFMGEAKECQVKLGDKMICLRLHPATEIEVGQSINLSLNPDKCRALAD